MASVFVFFLVVLALVSPHAVFVVDAATTAAEANQYVDDLLAEVCPRIRENLDPASLPEGGVGFEKKLIFVTVKGEAKVYEGWLAGLSTLHRTGDARVTRTKAAGSGEVVTVDAQLGLGNLVGHYKAFAKFMNLGPSFDLTVSIPAITVSMSIQQSVDVEGSTPALTFFNIEKVGEIEIELEGSLGILDWIFNKVSSLVANLVKRFVKSKIEVPIRDILTEKLKKISLTKLGGI